MQIDQILRRLTWRVRRRFRRAADNDPMVTIEQPPPAPSLPRPRNKRLVRIVQTATAFLATLVVLAVAYGLVVAVNSRARLDIGADPDVVVGASDAVAAAAALLAPEAQGSTLDVPFVPNGRVLREGRLRDGAADVAAHFVALAGPAHGRTDPALADARAALPVGSLSSAAQRIAARDALIRLNTRIAHGQAQLDNGRTALAALVRAAADSCERQSAALAALAAKPSLLAPPATDAQMHEARGVAYGWLLIVRAALKDAPDLAQGTAVEATIPLDALARAVAREPLVLFNGGKASPWAPAHVADAAADFARAAAGARALADAVAQGRP